VGPLEPPFQSPHHPLPGERRACTVSFAIGVVASGKAAESQGPSVACCKPRPAGPAPPGWLSAISVSQKTERANTRFAVRKEKAIPFLAGLKEPRSILDVSVNNGLWWKGTFAWVVAVAMDRWVSAGARLDVVAEPSSRQYSVVGQLVKDLADVRKWILFRVVRPGKMPFSNIYAEYVKTTEFLYLKKNKLVNCLYQACLINCTWIHPNVQREM